MPAVSVIIPTLNAGAALHETLSCLRAGDAGLVSEIIVSDGGSSDDTRDRAASAGCTVVDGPSGRGEQLVLGAAHARGEWLLFLHADTHLSEYWGRHAAALIEEQAEQDVAAVFQFALDDASVKARVLEWIVAGRVRILALPYGDQALLISRRFYDRTGGFAAIPLMEDVDIMRRIGRRRLRVLPVAAVTSASRYRRAGYFKRVARNAACLSLYYCGASPQWLQRFYG